MNIQMENVIKKDKYINQMWNDITKMFGNEKHSYLIVRNYDIYDDMVFDRIEQGFHFWSDVSLQVNNDVDFTELLQCIDPDVLNIGICNSLPHTRQVPTYVRVTYADKKYYIYKIKNSIEFKKLVGDRYCLSNNNNIQTEYGEKLAKFFGEIRETITINN